MTDYERFEYRSEEGRTWLAISFLMVGMGVGALLGLLYAPKSGRQMRRSLRRRYEDVRDRIDEWSEQANEMIEKGSEWAGTAKEKGADWADTAKERVKPLRKAISRRW